MKWYADLEPIVKENVSLAQRTWYHLGGAARYFCTPCTVEQIGTVVRRCREQELPLRVLGAGANVLVRDEGFDGVVIQLDPVRFGQTMFETTEAITGGAVRLPDLVRRSVLRGLSGLEGLAGIPGSVGGSLRMNAGGKFGEIGQAVREIRFVDPDGQVRTWGRDRLSFAYRRSNLDEAIIVGAVFALQPDNRAVLKERYRDIWNFKSGSQPFTHNNAGCMFKNPAGHKAGQLIDLAGLKGASCGGASVSTRHANFILAASNARTDDILRLTDRIRDRVREQFNVDLELEVDVW